MTSIISIDFVQFSMFIFKVNSVLNARVLELDDELKEAYNKYDNLKSELVVLFISFRF